MVSEIVPGQVYQLTDRVRRITAANPGKMTGPGTNTYLVGQEQIAVIDPGPALPSHIDTILDTCGDRLQWIIATHTHRDHSPAAARLAEATGAKVLGNQLPDNDGFQDDSFNPVKGFAHDEVLQADEFTLRALFTPGHVDNHLCYLVEEDGLLLTGDHIMQGSTVVIIPPHGDMKDYIDSLRLLLDYPLTAIGPGHGHIILNPHDEVKGLIAHRLRREAKVIEKLGLSGPVSTEQLTPLVYDDVDSSLHTIASYSLMSHLIKLQKEHRAELSGDIWTLIA